MNFIEEDIADISSKAIELGFNDKSFLISGSTGLIGSMLVKTLLKITNEKNIYLVSKGINKLSSYWNGMKANCLSYDELNKIKSVDYIIHLAAPTSSKYMTEKPVETISFMIESTKSLLELVKEKNAKLLYISSMEAYGEIYDDNPKNENELGYIPLDNVRSSYSEAKRLCELLCYSYAKEYGVSTYIARLSQTFGAGVFKEESRIFGYLARCVINNEDIVLKTKGDSYGNYCYLADTISAFFYILARGEEGETYNVVGDNMRYTILELANILANKFANDSIGVKIQLDNSGIYPNPTKLNMSNNKIKALGWKPRYNIVDAFNRMIGSWKE